MGRETAGRPTSGRLSRQSARKERRSSPPSARKNDIVLSEPIAIGSADGWPAQGRPAGGGARCKKEGRRRGRRSAVTRSDNCRGGRHRAAGTAGRSPEGYGSAAKRERGRRNGGTRAHLPSGVGGRRVSRRARCAERKGWARGVERGSHEEARAGSCPHSAWPGAGKERSGRRPES